MPRLENIHTGILDDMEHEAKYDVGLLAPTKRAPKNPIIENIEFWLQILATTRPDDQKITFSDETLHKMLLDDLLLWKGFVMGVYAGKG